MKTSGYIYKIQFNAALGSNDCFAPHKEIQHLRDQYENPFAYNNSNVGLYLLFMWSM